jgi:hypothetical protein
VARIIMRAMRLTPAERYQTADEMLVDVERVLRTEYQSAGQTELKLWMAQLARRDGSQSFGKTRSGGPSATIADGGNTDLNVVGSSFELVDFDDVVVTNDSSFAPGAVVPAGKGPPPVPQSTPPGGAPIGSEVAPPPRDTAAMRAVEQKSRGLRGFWFGATFALAAVIGARYVIEWARTQPFFAGGAGGSAPAAIGPAAPPPSSFVPAPSLPPPAPTKPAAGTPPEAKGGATTAAGAGAADAAAAGHPAEVVAAAGARKPDAGGAVAKDDSTPEPDEEALLRQALPNAESAVIGEEEADSPAPEGKNAGAAAKAGKAGGHPSSSSSSASSKGAAPAPAKSETVSLHITSTPVGAVVRTNYKVLGRTPISLHFRGGNTYELVFIKQGYAQTTRRVTIAGGGGKDRKVAVVLKKNRTPSGRPSLFHIHR